MSQNPFNIVTGVKKHPGEGQVSTPENSQEKAQVIIDVDKTLSLDEQIKSLISSSPIFLFMKGVPSMPQCGFSANVIGLLNHYQVEYKTFNILADQEIRQAVKEFSNWPTFPQLYVNEELIGGNDIVMELYEAKELAEILGVTNK